MCTPFRQARSWKNFANAAGEVAYEALECFVVRLRVDVKTWSQIVLEDDEGLQIILGPSAPADALLNPPDALLNPPDDVREAAGEAGQLYWDQDEGRWKEPRATTRVTRPHSKQLWTYFVDRPPSRWPNDQRTPSGT
jgi:hypothetical protein